MTKPTRLQEQACDRFADALLAITEGARFDGAGKLDAADLAEIAGRLARASSAFDLDQIVSRALEKRSRTLGLRAGSAELLTLLEGEQKPLDLLRLTDLELRAVVESLEQELEGV